MPTTEYPRVDPGVASRLPAGPILMRLRGLLVTTGIAAFVYSALASSSRTECTGGGGSDLSPAASMCAGLTARPSWLVYAAFAVILFVAIGRVARRAATVPEALRTLDRAAILIIAVALVSVVIGTVWMFLIPLDPARGTGTTILPFPFVWAELTFTPAP